MAGTSQDVVVDAILDDDAFDDEFDVPTSDGDSSFFPVHDFEIQSKLLGTYSGEVKSVETKNGKRSIHVFSAADGYDGPVEIWGGTILDQELPKVAGMRCAVVFHGKVKNYNKFTVHPAKAALAARDQGQRQ